MKVALFQQDIVWGNPEANWRSLGKMFDKVSDIDLFVLPEMFSTGFVTSNPEIAEKEPVPSLSWMKEQAAARNCAIVGSVAVNSGGSLYNRFYFVEPDGKTSVYDKRHLFAYGGEDRCFTAGENRCIVEYRGVRFLPEICYDLRFPVWSRNKGDYDVAVYVANWPVKRQLAWDTLVRARAIENQCIVLAVNRCGTDPILEYEGGSAVYNAYGELVASCERGKEGIVIAELDIDELKDYCRKFPVSDDADEFKIII